MVEDLFTTKNKLVDKSGDIDRQAKPLLGDTFLFSKTDDNWKQKRQACAHAFYKDRMENLMSVLKDIMEKHMMAWHAQIVASPDNSTTIDVHDTFEQIFGQTMVQISFGEDILDQMIDLQVHKDKKFRDEKMNINKATSTVFGQLLGSAIFKKIHPIGCFYRLITKKSVALTNYTRTIDKNAKTVRQFVLDYVLKRKSQ